MKNYIKDFCKRGFMFGAWSGPLVLAIVWMCLNKVGVVTQLTVNEAILGIVTTIVMGFVAAGISVIYTIEKLPKAFAGLIQFAVLYIDYLGFYLFNGWLPFSKIWMFTLIFLVGFIAIWLSIYFSIKFKVNKMNKQLEK